LSAIRVSVLHLYTKFEVHTPSLSEDMTHFRSLTLKLVRIIARGMDNLSTNVVVSRTFRSRLIGQHLSYASRDLATLTLTFEVTALVADAGLRALSAKFEVRRPSRSAYCFSSSLANRCVFERGKCTCSFSAGAQPRTPLGSLLRSSAP